jgi:hypothetical protein
MLTGMRYSIVVFMLFALACSKRESPPEAAAETKAPGQAETEGPAAPTPKAAQAPLPPAEPPTVQLITAGKPPLQEIRWHFQEGAKEVLETTTAQVLEMRGGGWDDRFLPVGIARTVDFVTNAVSAEGTAEVAFHIRETAEIETPDANSPAIEGAKGATGTYNMDSTGVIRDFVLVPAPDSKFAAHQLDTLKALLRMTVFPVPTEAVGVGAKWTVTQVVHEQKMAIKEQMSIELLKHAGSRIAVRAHVKGSGSRQSDISGNPQTITINTDTKVLAKMSSTKVVSRSSELESQTIQTVETADGDASTNLKMTIDRTVGMQSK